MSALYFNSGSHMLARIAGLGYVAGYIAFGILIFGLLTGCTSQPLAGPQVDCTGYSVPWSGKVTNPHVQPAYRISMGRDGVPAVSVGAYSYGAGSYCSVNVISR